MIEKEQQPATDNRNYNPKWLWLIMTNICDKGKFRVALEADGVEHELLHTYVMQDECVVSDHHNLTCYLEAAREAGFQAAQAEAARLRQTLEEVREGLALMAEGEGDDETIYQEIARHWMKACDKALATPAKEGE